MSSSTKQDGRGVERRSAPRADHDARALPGAWGRRVDRGLTENISRSAALYSVDSGSGRARRSS
jgi:hypothetical protein